MESELETNEIIKDLNEALPKFVGYYKEVLNRDLFTINPFEVTNDELFEFLIYRSRNRQYGKEFSNFCTVFTNRGVRTNEWNGREYNVVCLEPLCANYGYKNIDWLIINCSSFIYGMSYCKQDQAEQYGEIQYNPNERLFHCTVDDKIINPDSYFNSEKNKERMYINVYSFKAITSFSTIKNCYRLYSLPDNEDERWSSYRIFALKAQYHAYKHLLQHPYYLMRYYEIYNLKHADDLYHDYLNETKKFYYDNVFMLFKTDLETKILSLEEQIKTIEHS